MQRIQRKLLSHAPALLLCLIVGAIAFAFFRFAYAGPEPPVLPELTETETEIDTGAYTSLPLDESEIGKGDLILVNDENHYRFPGGENLKSVFDFKNGSYKVSDKNVMLRSAIADYVNQMFEDFYRNRKYADVCIISGHRTAEYQQNLLAKRTRAIGSEASDWVANPGASEHHTGYAMDLGIYTARGESYQFTGDGACVWLTQNAYKYGFVVRYPSDKSALTGISYEPWHFRYVGAPHAYLITKDGLCLEEYIDQLRRFEFGKQHLTVKGYEGKNYEIYFVKSTGKTTQVPVPKDGTYTISGNNADGFIVTIQKTKSVRAGLHGRFALLSITASLLRLRGWNGRPIPSCRSGLPRHRW